MSTIEKIWVFVDATYRVEGPDRHVAAAEALGVQVTGDTREVARQNLVAALAGKIGQELRAGRHAEYLEAAGFYPRSSQEWLPRISCGDERLFVPVGGFQSSLPMVPGGSPGPGTDPGSESGETPG